MNDTTYTLWTTGRPLEAGRILYEQLPIEERPLWAAALLAVCAELLPPIAEITNVLRIARDPSLWTCSRAAFNAVRQLTIQIPSSHPSNALYMRVLSLAEVVAKVTYNATGSPAPYDYHAGWRIMKHVREIVELHGHAEFEARVWSLATNPTAR